MFPLALVCGNTFVMKPSELDPGATMMLMEMAIEAGVPNGAVNVIHGQKECETIYIAHKIMYKYKGKYSIFREILLSSIPISFLQQRYWKRMSYCLCYYYASCSCCGCANTHIPCVNASLVPFVDQWQL